MKIKTPIEQHMLGRGGLFRQENMEKRKVMSVREWAELCAKEEFRAPGIHEVGVHTRGAKGAAQPTRKSTRKKTKAEPIVSDPPIQSPVKRELCDDDQPLLFGDVRSTNQAAEVSATPMSPTSQADAASATTETRSEQKPKAKKRTAPKKEAKDAEIASRLVQDLKFLETFEPHEHWLRPGITAADYTPEFCQSLERRYWRNCGLGKPAWYGADTQGKALIVLAYNT